MNNKTINLRYLDTVEKVLQEAERNVRQQGLVGFSRTWFPATFVGVVEVFPISAYLTLKGIKYRIGDHDVVHSDYLEEMSIMNSLAE